jgi:surfactin synthase thioesterase subunit
METQASDNAAWIRRYHRASDEAIRLVCLPHAGGSASFYFPVSRALAPDVEVLCVQYPGRQDRRHEPNITSIPDLADQVYQALLPWADRPMAFFGHSMGAILGFELALRAAERGDLRLAHLFASGRRAPSRYRDEQVHRRTDQEIVARLRGLKGTETAVLGDAETLSMILPAVRGDYQAIETYRHRPGAVLDVPVTVIVGDQDEMTTLEEAGDWAEHTTGPFDMSVFPGGHFYLTEHAAQVIELISATVSRVGLVSPAGAVPPVSQPR